MVSDIKKLTYFESAHVALQEMVQGIIRLAELENYLGEEGYYDLPTYLREGINALIPVISKVHPPKTNLEMEQFLSCFDSRDFSAVIKKKERQLGARYDGARIYAREKTKNRKDP